MEAKSARSRLISWDDPSATVKEKVTGIESGKLLAHGTTTCLITPARSA
jgi:hypothetical protein